MHAHSASIRLLVGNSLSLIGAQAVNSALGAAFWWYAARSFSAAAIGIAGAVVSAMLLLGSIANLGLGTLMMGELPRMRGDRAALVSVGLAASTLFGTALGLAACAFAPLVSTDFSALRHDWLSALVFSLGVGATAAAIVLDQALIGLFRGRVQLWRNTFFSIVKLVGLAVAAAIAVRDSSVAIYGCWTVATLFSITVVVAAAGRLPLDRLRVSQWNRFRGLTRSVFEHFGFNLALQLPTFALPILAVALLSAEQNASFYLAWQVAFLLFIVPISVTSVLFSVVAGEPTAIGRMTRLSLGASIAVSLAGMLVLYLGASEIMRVFGAHYVSSAAPTLQILVLAAIPLTIKSHYVAVYRIAGRISRALPLVWTTAALEIAAAAAGARWFGTLRGFSGAWLVMLAIESTLMIVPVRAATRAADAAELTGRLSS